MDNKEIAKNKIKDLVEKFEGQYKVYTAGGFDEKNTRNQFIDPFWDALGWDVNNHEGISEAYRKVIQEDKIEIDGTTKAPDYAFKMEGGKRLFYLEAKKPSVNVHGDVAPAFQVRRYGWTAKLPISIVSDFEEFAIYETINKPKLTDKSSVGRVDYFTFRDYINKFDFIWDTFSYEAVRKGGLDKYLKFGNKKGTSTVDKEFLDTLDEFRLVLAKNVAKNNLKLNDEEISLVVQKNIDRILFLRIAEARGIESQDSLKKGVKEKDCYKNLLELFFVADKRYNSGLFDFKKDKLSTELKIDDNVIKEIIENLYYPKSPYEFSVLGIEIIGSAYEQFLGKVIRTTNAHLVKIEEKPEVRKAGGVYYTPQYIVEYIVKNTVGKLCENKTYEEVSKLKIVDPACGSGSFLIGAYDYLLKWNLDYFTKNETRIKEARKNNFLTPTNLLSTIIKKQILLNNIFGVDLDANAIEVTKLSLSIKCMEGENGSSVQDLLSLTNERLLPTLDDNIKCGNSLIDLDYFEGQLDMINNEEEEKKIKPFSWAKNFPSVFANGGFDAVIGNPPYINTKRGFAENLKENKYLKNKYKVANGQFDAYTLFIEKAIALLNENGFWSFIIPKPVLSNENMMTIRSFILENGKIKNIADFGMPFEDASVEAVVICQNKNSKVNDNIEVFNYKTNTINILEQSIFLNTQNKSFIINTNSKIEKLLNKIEQNKKTIKDISSIFIRGVECGKKDDLIFDKMKNKNCVPLLRGQDVWRYNIKTPNLFIQVDNNDLSKFKSPSVYKNKKILIRRVGSELQATIDSDGFYDLNTVYNLSLKDFNYEFVLGVFNSKLISYWFKNKFIFDDKLFPYARISQLETIPIPSLDLTNPTQKSHHDEIVKMVENLLELNKKKQITKSDSDLELIKNKIDFCEDKINKIVYQIYGLTAEEVGVVENNK